MPLSQDQIDSLRRRMDERRARELQEIRSVAERARDDRLQAELVGRETDPSDEALRRAAEDADFAVVRQDIQDVRDIDGAYQRIAAGTYGTCIVCGKDIGYERLLAYPTAKRCIGCQSEHEKKRASRA
jgi:DnaK suppressor protein